MSDKLNQAIATIKAGDKQTGGQLLIEILKTEPHNENAWLWMTQVVSKKDEIKCLERVLKINPDNAIAKKGMARLKPVETPNLDNIAPETNAPIIQRKKRERTESTIRRLEKTEKPRTTSSPNDKQLIQQYIAKRTSQGWQVINQTDSSVQLRKPKRWSITLLVLGGVFLILFGLGLIFWILAVIDYAIKKEQTIFVTVNELRKGTEKKPASSMKGPLGLAGVLIGGFILCIVFSLAPAMLITPTSNNTSPSNPVATSTPQPTPTKKTIKPTPTVKPLGWTGDATEYTFHTFRIGKRGTYLGGVLLDGKGQIEVYLGHGQDIDHLELVADCYSDDEVGCGVGFVLDLREGEHFFEVISDGPYTLVLERK